MASVRRNVTAPVLVGAPAGNEVERAANRRDGGSVHDAPGTGHGALSDPVRHDCDVLYCSRDTLERAVDLLDAGDVAEARAILSHILTS
ncbi:MAG: hypothetical protein CVU63_19905 [Deltaproteobacteria bacterium HGW-Deltaproteobacteria-20]|nr:MAG: hypothetical protein CVU63_19905 [Deltaproteobacteria bacterium HGW-Deltaproteobacteria-20]